MKIPTSLLKVFARLDGCKVYGHLTTPEVGTTSPNTPFLNFHVPEPNRLVKTGDLMKGNNGDILLLMDSPQTHLAAKTFRAYPITTKYPWIRNVKTIDPVARVERDQGITNLGEVYAYFEKPQDSAVNQMLNTRYQFYTGQEVKEGDVVGGKTVKRVMPLLGVKLVIAE